MTWVTHKDGGLDLLLSSRGDGDRGARKTLVGVAASTVCIIEDLTTLRVSDQDEECVWALGVERVDLTSNSRHSLYYRVGIADITTRGLATACGVVDGLGGSAREGGNDGVDNWTSGTVAWWDGRLAGSEDVDLRALS